METTERLRRRANAVQKIEVALDKGKTYSGSGVPARHVAEAVTELARMEVATLLAEILARAESGADVYALAGELLPEFGQARKITEP